VLGIYVHIPFCLKKCNYCSFVSFVHCENDIENYITALEKEIKLFMEYTFHNFSNEKCFTSQIGKYNINKNKQVSTIFFGGGTPSILSIKQLKKILQMIRKYFDVVENCEITIECNPAMNIDFIGLQQISFNRISIGVQSFNDKELQLLERLHNSKTAKNTILEAKKYFDNVSIDLIYGIPNQTLKSLEYTLNTAISLDLKHISAYNLIYEENTKLNELKKKNEFSVLIDDYEVEMYSLLCNTLKNNDFKQYEVSNFAKINYESKHNQAYWNRQNYIGFGLAAHSFLENVRFSNTVNLKDYIHNLEQNQLPVVSKETLTVENIYEEKIFLGLRSRGIDKKLLNEKQTQFMKECIKSDFAVENNTSFILTSKGKFITDSMVLNILEKYFCEFKK
jgi:oxygen-independent coproporphyrinogen-3 oxidase